MQDARGKQAGGPRRWLGGSPAENTKLEMPVIQRHAGQSL